MAEELFVLNVDISNETGTHTIRLIVEGDDLQAAVQALYRVGSNTDTLAQIVEAAMRKTDDDDYWDEDEDD